MTTANETAENTANEDAYTDSYTDPNIGVKNKRDDDNSGHVVSTDITTQMESAYLDYAMSVIVSRALPDVRDGLKPVHRRILYAMYSDLHLTADKSHKKSARIVGEVLGKYHPHGDQSVYDAMVRMAQEFSMRYPLIDGQGNFGSIDGDGAAAMRYTEARLDAISNLMLDDLAKDTVDWHDNFDSTLQEPDILPAALPNLLINGSNGIAVGMATNIPPHNLGEVVDALEYMIDNFKRADEITVDELMQFVKGPDFPTGGILYRYREGKAGEDATDAIAQGYAVGRSRLILQAKAHFEEMSRNRSRIVVTELPFQTNKTALIERIAMLVRDGKIEGITDLRDESDRTGMRIVIEMTRNVDAKRILERLFKLTPLQQTFGMQMLSLVDGEPMTLGLRRMLQLFIEHRQVIVRRRTEYDLARARERAHIVEGLLRALDILDEVIATIRASQRVETARDNLVKNFQFSVIQAQAILDMQLRRLAALERKKLQDEYKELTRRIKYLEGLLESPKKMLKVIKEELLAIKEQYGDVRKTQLVERTKGTLTSTDLLPDQEVWVTVSSAGELRRQASIPKPGSSEAKQIGKDAGLAILNGNTKDPLYLFGKDGQCRQISIHEIPHSGGPKHASMYTDFTRRDTINAALTLPRDPGTDGYLFLVTELGMVKRITIADFAKSAPLDPIVMGVDPKDKLGWVFPTDGNQEILLVTSSGHSIRFSEGDVRSMGLGAGGVGGMKIKKDHHIIYAGIVDPNGEVLTMTEQGYAKRTAMGDYGTQGRNGGGITTHKPTTRTGDVSAAMVVNAAFIEEPDEAYIVAVTDKGVPKTHPISGIPQMGRSVQGKLVVAVDLGGKIVTLHAIKAPPPPSPNGNGSGGNGSGGNGPGSNGSGGNGSNGNGSRTNGSTTAQGKATAGTSSTGASARRKATVSAQKSSSNGSRTAAGRATVTGRASTATKARVSNGATAQKGTTTTERQSSTANRRTTRSRAAIANASQTKAGPAKATSQRTVAKATTAKPAVKVTTAKAATAKATSKTATTSAKATTNRAVTTKAKATTVRPAKSTSAKSTAAKSATAKSTVKKSAAVKPTTTKTTTAKPSTRKAVATKAAATKSAATKSARTAAKKTKVASTAQKTTKVTATKATTSKSATAKSAASKTRATKAPAAKAQPVRAQSTKAVAAKSRPTVAKPAVAKAAKPKPTATKPATKTSVAKPAAKKAPAKRSAKLATVTSVKRGQAKGQKSSAKKTAKK